MQSRRSTVVAIILVLASLTAACGSRLDEDARQQAITDLKGGGGSGGTDSGGTDDGGATDGGVAIGTTGDATTGGTDAAATAGGTTDGATGGTTGGTTGGGAACVPGKAASTGVTPTEIKVGNVSQLTGLVPGFAQTSVNGVKAYFNYLNTTQRGVCGRKLTLVQADDRFQAATNRSETEKLAGQVVAFAGSLSVVDDGGAPIIESKGVADVSLATTPPRTAAKNNFTPNPIDPTPGAGNGQDKVLTYLKQTRGITKGAIFYQDVATGVNQSKQYEIDMVKAGIQVVAKYAVAPTATNFRSQATDMKQKGIEVVMTVAEINAISNLARAFADVGYKPKAPFYGAQTYSQKFIKLAGAAAEGAMAGMIFHVPEEAASVPAMGTFSQWYQRTAPGADVDFFAVLGWVAGEIVAKAIANAGPDPTQAKVIAELGKFTAYESEIVSQINLAGKKTPKCFIVVEVQGGKWVKVHPSGAGFACP